MTASAMLDYIPIILAFAAAIVAIGGEKKMNPAKRGLRRLTKTGWAAFALAVVALLTGIATTWRSHVALEAQALRCRHRNPVSTAHDHTEFFLASR
jgi:hypothetical protein